MSKIIKELINPIQYNSLPWLSINFLMNYKKKLDIEEVLCLIENIYLENEELHSFKITNKSINRVLNKHPEAERLYNKGWTPSNYLVHLTFYGKDGKEIDTKSRRIYENILSGYGYTYLKRIIKNRFSNISRIERFDSYTLISIENQLQYEEIISRWKNKSKTDFNLYWLRDKEYGITLPTAYYNYNHFMQLKHVYESFIPYWDLEMEVESLDFQQLIWKIEMFFNLFQSLEEIVLRDPYHTIRNNSVLSFERDFFYRIKVNEEISAIFYEDFSFNICDWDLDSALNTKMYKMLTEEAIILGRNKELRFTSYKKMIDNLKNFNTRVISENFLNILYHYDFENLK